MTSLNPAALQGWIKSIDPKTGRVFYANHITRKTQWEAPEGWKEEPASQNFSLSKDTLSKEKSTTFSDEDGHEPLPSGWEVMYDPTSGKPFYIDHVRKITTWTRPKAEKTTASMSLLPATAASPSSGNSAALARILQQQQQRTSSIRRSYQQEAAYYQNSQMTTMDVDFSDSLPKLDFTVKKVPDSLRPICPSCNSAFTMSKRRHHCRLCGDVFCDTCSSHRCTLPLDGPEFEKPVRVCDFCFKDIDVGNFFSVRRYLTVLHLVDPSKPDLKIGDDDAGVATRSNVNAALSALCQDLQQMVQSGDTSLHEKVKIPPEILVPEILKHLKHTETADRATCCIASLVALESLAGDQKSDYTTAIYIYGKKDAIDYLLKILERSGSDRRSLFVQEQCARTLYYLTEARIIAATTRKVSELSGNDDEDEDIYGDAEESLDIKRSIRALLDHASTTQNPNLQRWATACIKNLVIEDERRATMAVNNVAAIIASGDRGSKALQYESCLDDLVNTGGVMILGSLIGADDADIRAHAVGALGATLASTRAVDSSMVALHEMTGGEFGRTTSKDGEIVRAIIEGGGCGSAVSQLLLSAENSVAWMGCSLLSSLVTPLLSDPAASASLSPQYDYRNDQSGSIGACREASVEIANGSCLPALISLVREQGSSRSLELRAMATTTLAAVVSSIGEMGRSWAQGAYEEGLERTGAPSKLKGAIQTLNEESVIDEMLQILQSGSGQSLGSSKATPSSRIRESAGIVLGSLTSCSSEAIMTLQNTKILSSLFLSSTDASMTTPSILRGDAAPRCLGILECVSAVLMFTWQHPSGASSELLDHLIEMIDAGAVPYASRVINIKIDWDSNDKSVGAMKGRAAACRLLCCLFGIALVNENEIGMRRLLDAVDSDSRSYRGSADGKQNLPSNIVEATLGCLLSASNQARNVVNGGSNHGHHYQTALMDLVEASLLAVGSMCGSSIAPGGSEGVLVTGENFLASRNDGFVTRRKEICNVACDVVVRGGRSGPSLLPTMLVGGCGEGSVLASLRLALAIAQNGTTEQHTKLALSGILVPISDLLRSALANGDIYKFSSSLTLVRFCGPYVAAGQGGGLESVRGTIRVATNVLILPVDPEATLKQMETQEILKAECISALEALSRNASLWSSISTDALPSVVRYLHTSVLFSSSKSPRSSKTTCGALRAILQIVQIPSHAVTVAETGITEPLSKLLYTEGSMSQEDEIPLLSLEILHVVSKNPEARRKAKFLESGLIRSICVAVGKSTTTNPKQPSDSRADVTFIGIEIIHSVLYELQESTTTSTLLQSKDAALFLASIATDPRFVRALCSSMLLSTNMELPRQGSDTDTIFKIPMLYGPPLINVQEKCAGYENTHRASESLLFNAAVFACAMESSIASDSFWKSFLLKDLAHDSEEGNRASATLAAHFLALLSADHTPFFPTDASRLDEFTSITRPLVRHRLLEILMDSINNLSGKSGDVQQVDTYMTALIVGFNIPHICLSLWKDPALLDLAFELIKLIVEQSREDVLHLFVDGKSAIESLFDLLNLDSSFGSMSNVGEIRRFLAYILAQLAESGLLKDAIERYEVRSKAIAALAAACVSEDERAPDEDDDMTSNKLSTVLMRCLVDLCTAKTQNGSAVSPIELSQAESEAIAINLGKKLCHMVLSRFLERSKLQQYEMDDYNDNLLGAPDVVMLCAIAQHDASLRILRSIGGLHALSLIAAEGEMDALVALTKACKSDPNVLLEGDAYRSVIDLLCTDDSRDWRSNVATKRRIESSAFTLLASLCGGSKAGRKAVSEVDSVAKCVERATYVVSSFISDISNDVTSSTEEQTDQEEPSGDCDSDSVNKACRPPISSTILDKNPFSKVTNNEDTELVIAACSFLSALVSCKVGRSQVQTDSKYLQALSLLSRYSPVAEMQFASINLVMAMAPYVISDGLLNASFIYDVAVGVLGNDAKITISDTCNANRMKSLAVNGLSFLLDEFDHDRQSECAHLIASHFTTVVRNVVVAKSTMNDDERAVVAEFAYRLSAILLVIRGKEFVDSVFSQSVLTALCHLIQWRHDPKTILGKSGERFWDACVSNCLIMLSSLLSRPEEILKRAGVNVPALISTPLMLARPGKAPRRAIDLQATLQLIVQRPDATASVAATLLLENIF